jgi:hypothetical protein
MNIKQDVYCTVFLLNSAFMKIWSSFTLAPNTDVNSYTLTEPRIISEEHLFSGVGNTQKDDITCHNQFQHPTS